LHIAETVVGRNQIDEGGKENWEDQQEHFNRMTKSELKRNLGNEKPQKSLSYRQVIDWLLERNWRENSSLRKSRAIKLWIFRHFINCWARWFNQENTSKIFHILCFNCCSCRS
jgi:hypothetical protein